MGKFGGSERSIADVDRSRYGMIDVDGEHLV
jgi:hypothetical protein